MDSPLKFYDISQDDVDKVLCYPTHCSVGDRDSFILTGSLKLDSSKVFEDFLGMEFSGYNDRQERIMGIVPNHVRKFSSTKYFSKLLGQYLNNLKWPCLI